MARGLTPASERLAQAVFVSGAYGAAIGGANHALTGLVLHVEGLRGGPVGDPAAVVARYGAYLVPLWALLGLLVVAGSGLFAVAVLRGGSRFPRWMAAANVALLLAGVSLLALPSAWLRAFLLPAGPNLVHVVFFALTARALAPERQSVAPA